MNSPVDMSTGIHRQGSTGASCHSRQKQSGRRDLGWTGRPGSSRPHLVIECSERRIVRQLVDRLLGDPAEALDARSQRLRNRVTPGRLPRAAVEVFSCRYQHVRVHLLHPRVEEIADPTPLYDVERPELEQRPWFVASMITSLDGAITHHGRSGPLGNETDRRVLQILRSSVDAIVVGAQTVRTERYGPVRLDDAQRRRRLLRGRPPQPRVAIVSSSLDLDPTLGVFENPEPPLIFTTLPADDYRWRRLSGSAELVSLTVEELRAEVLAREFSARGWKTILCEGGSRLNSLLVQSEMLDELCLTISPHLVGGPGPRLLAENTEDRLRRFRLVNLATDEGWLFLRYLRDVHDVDVES